MGDYKENENFEKYFYESKFIEPINFSEKYDTYIYKANMGMGKTESLKNIVNTYEKVLIISFRISLDIQYVKQFEDFKLYSDINSYIDMDIEKKVVVQINSLHKVMGNPDVIILDEITYTLDTLLSLEKNRDNCYDVLKQYMSSNIKLIIMDALIEKDIMNWISSFNKKILYIENTYKKHTKLKVNYYKHYWSQFRNDMVKDIEEGKKIAFVTNCRNRMLYIKDKFKTIYIDKKSLFIDRDSEDKYSIEKWDKLDFLSYTPTITAGISFTKKHYDKVYGYFINNSATAEMSIQQLFRIRNLNENILNICIENKEKDDYPMINEEIDDYICNFDKNSTKRIPFLKFDVINKEIIKDAYYHLYKYIMKLKYISYNDYFKRMKILLESQGVKIFNEIEDKIPEKDRKTEAKEIKEYNLEIKKIESENIVNAWDIDDEHARLLAKQANISLDEKNSLKKYTFINATQASKLTSEVYMKYNKFIPQLNNSVYYNLFKDDIWNILNTSINYTEIKKNLEDNRIRLHLRKKYEQIAWVIYIFDTLGFKNNKILEYSENDKLKLNKETIKNFLIKNHKEIETVFRTKKYDWLNIIREDNKWFTKMFRYLNERVKKIFKLSLKRKIINNELYVYISGNDFWVDDEVSYKNKILMEKVIKKQKSIDEFVETNIETHCNEEKVKNGDFDEIAEETCDKLIAYFNNTKNCIGCDKRFPSFNSKLCLCCRFKVEPEDYDNFNLY